MWDIAHLLRSGHLQQLRTILDDPEASANDRFVALDLLKNACISAGGVLPMLPGRRSTAIVMGKRGQQGPDAAGGDEAALARGIQQTYDDGEPPLLCRWLPLTMWEEKNTDTNTPRADRAVHDATDGDAYTFLFMAKGGGVGQQELPVPGDRRRC